MIIDTSPRESEISQRVPLYKGFTSNADDFAVQIDQVIENYKDVLTYAKETTDKFEAVTAKLEIAMNALVKIPQTQSVYLRNEICADALAEIRGMK